MNVLLILILIITGLCVWRGFSRGMFRSVLVAGATILAIILSRYATPYVSDALQKYTKIDEKIEASVVETLRIEASDHELTKNEQMQWIEDLPIPEALKMAVINNNNSVTYEKMSISNFYEYVAHYLCCIVMNCLAFVSIQVILTVGLLLLVYLSNVLTTEIPILYGMDKTGGVVLGLLQALAIIWSIFVFVSLIGNTSLGMMAYEQINRNWALSFIYEHNLLLDTVTNITYVLSH